MNKIMKNNKGITLAALVITIIIMIIIASIAVYEGTEMISKSKVQTIQTNMLTIQAKAKAYAEEIEAKVWALKEGTGENKKEGKRQKEFKNKGLIGPTESNGKLEYTFDDDGLKNMGLDELNASDYIVIFSNDYNSIDVKYKNGIQYENNTYYTLSELEQAMKTEE